MRRTRVAVAAVVVVALAVSAAALLAVRRRQAQEKEAAQQQAEVRALEKEVAALRSRLEELVPRDPRLGGMPSARARVGVPTTLIRSLVEKVAAGVVDQVVLELSGLKAHKEGTIKKVVTLGQYGLDVNVDRVRARLRTGTPEVRFGGNAVVLALPVELAEGTGEATVHFTWDGRSVAGAVCGDLDLTRQVTGRVRPFRQVVRGSVTLVAGDGEILASPSFPPIRLDLRVEPSAPSWAALQAVLDEKKGLCGFVLDKVDVRKTVEEVVARGFKVRLPTERVKPIAVPVGFEPALNVRGNPVDLGLRVGDLVITEHAFWLGAEVRVFAPTPDRR